MCLIKEGRGRLGKEYASVGWPTNAVVSHWRREDRLPSQQTYNCAISPADALKDGATAFGPSSRIGTLILSSAARACIMMAFR
ncbi:hypothetical protein niasHS_015995 [Heterodera schachtii]|uniref:Uncharacterized protein n=1 Tax=Heterodera schachtii TaxID=97005 RepID=A0ABD2HXL8_HETSC